MNRAPGKEKWKQNRMKGKKDEVIREKKKKRQAEEDEITNLQRLYQEHDPSTVETFNDIPLSERTRRGLAENNFTVPTEIQRECIGVALKGNDVLGAAKTGSGKTLAFLLPLLDILYANKWTKLDGLGGLIITPTRELALQIYETLCKVGKYHDFSVGLIVGGKDLKFERSRMHLVNIIICTPGRLLQHMDENPLFDCANLKILILDEADRCLDLGFEESMNCIIANLPKTRRTLLFSATQTKSVKDLVRLSLKDPKFISVHEHAKHKTPEGLIQSYVVCEQHDKFPMMWSFIKNHLRQKIIIFFSTCNQVKYTFDILCKLHPRITLLALHGKQNQWKRMEMYEAFCKKQHAVLFATDIAARGLDFPAVDWVIQLDCPEDVETYIHRAGRTARYQKGGECLLILRPSETKMVEYLQNNKIPIDEIKVNPAKLFSPQAKMEAFLAKDQNLKASAQRSFVAYVKSVFLMKDKTVFDVKSIDVDKYARSLGLVVSPRIRFLQKIEKRLQEEGKGKTVKEEVIVGVKSESESDEDSDNEAQTSRQLKHQKNLETYNFKTGCSDSEDDVLVLKRKHEVEPSSEEETESETEEPTKKKKKVVTKFTVAKRALKKKILPNKKVIFTEDGEAIANQTREKASELGRKYEEDAEGGVDIEEAKKVMREEDKYDRKLHRDIIRAKRREQKRKLKDERRMKMGLPPRLPKESDSEESEGSEPDLSWLPDPDKIYGKQNSDNEDSAEDRDVAMESDEGSRSEESEEDRRDNEEDDDDDDDGDAGLSLKDQEELALQLLSSK